MGGARLHLSETDKEVEAAMLLHGLSGPDRSQLFAEGVTNLDRLNWLRDQDFLMSGIDIESRRHEKLGQDWQAATERNLDALTDQVQNLLAHAGLSSHGREAVRSLPAMGALLELDLPSMQRIGLGIVDRRQLEEFIQSERVQRVQLVPVEEVLTEPERQARNPDELLRRQAQFRRWREDAWRQAAQRAASLVEEPIRVATTVTEAMDRHGLTKDEQKRLWSEGVTNLDTFVRLRDEDFLLSGIDIVARRQEKLERDWQVAADRNVVKIQVQNLLDEAGLTEQAREAVRALPSLEALRALDLAAMQHLGLGCIDRRMLEEFNQTDRVQGLSQAEEEEVLTELERTARLAESVTRHHDMSQLKFQETEMRDRVRDFEEERERGEYERQWCDEAEQRQSRDQQRDEELG
jgi:hypothetical protein